MSIIDIIKECPKCACPKQEIQYKNCGPVIRIRCPQCGFGMTEGVDTLSGVEVLVKSWNYAREKYEDVLRALYEAQENAPLPVQVQYDRDRCIIGIVTLVDCRKDIFHIEMPGEFIYESLDIWKVQKLEKIEHVVKAVEVGCPVKLWVDDLRPAPEGYEHVRSVREAQIVIEQIEAEGGTIEFIDLDHDLGDYARFGGDGIKLLDYLLQRETLYPVKFHTANPVGRANMERMVQRYWP